MLSMSLVEAGESPKEESALQEETKLYTSSEASHDMKSNKEGASCDACEVPTLTASLAEEEERILLSLNRYDCACASGITLTIQSLLHLLYIQQIQIVE